jgi:hypothetical protein
MFCKEGTMRKKNRKLALTKETLTALGNHETKNVQGAVCANSPSCPAHLFQDPKADVKN